MFARIGKHYEFEAAHKLQHHSGKCARLHGHTYKLEVEVYGEVKMFNGESDEGMVMDFGDLSAIVKRQIVDKYDHQYLNEFFTVPTAERLVNSFWADIITYLPEGIDLVRLRLYETSNSYAELNRFG